MDRGLAWLHRWSGVFVCLLFTMWFASGIVLHFVGFPSLSPEGRRSHGELIDLSLVRVEPQRALTTAGVTDLDDARVESLEGEPTYLFTSGNQTLAVSAVTGLRAPARGATFARHMAEEFSGASALTVVGPIEYDQWTVHQELDPVRPFFRVRLNDEASTDLYVSARSGEVVQRTRGAERAWNWCGAILHWIYFTPIRKDWSFWNDLVWWISLFAFATSIIGTWLGVVRTIASRRARQHTWTPFQPWWLRWHHLIGLGFAVFLLAWIASGWLSMDHGKLFTEGGIRPADARALRGLSWRELISDASLDRIRSVGKAAEIQFNSLASRPFLSVWDQSSSPRTIWLDTSEEDSGPLPSDLLRRGVQNLGATVDLLTASNGGAEALYRVAESVPIDAQGAVAPTGHTRRVYLDRYTGRAIALMDSSRLAYAWLYYGVHTLKFPGLNEHPTIRTVAVISLATLGLGFSLTGLVLAIKRVRRTVSIA